MGDSLLGDIVWRVSWGIGVGGMGSAGRSRCSKGLLFIWGWGALIRFLYFVLYIYTLLVFLLLNFRFIIYSKYLLNTFFEYPIICQLIYLCQNIKRLEYKITLQLK